MMHQKITIAQSPEAVATIKSAEEALSEIGGELFEMQTLLGALEDAIARQRGSLWGQGTGSAALEHFDNLMGMIQVRRDRANEARLQSEELLAKLHPEDFYLSQQ